LRFLELILFIEFGIYCELNLPGCLTFVVAPGSSVEKIDDLLYALEKMSFVVSDYPSLDNQIPFFDSGEFSAVEKNSILIHSSTEKIPLHFDNVDDLKSKIVGKMSAETVRFIFSYFFSNQPKNN
jgi:hypothetical protein